MLRSDAHDAEYPVDHEEGTDQKGDHNEDRRTSPHQTISQCGEMSLCFPRPTGKGQEHQPHGRGRDDREDEECDKGDDDRRMVPDQHQGKSRGEGPRLFQRTDDRGFPRSKPVEVLGELLVSPEPLRGIFRCCH